MSFRGSGWRLSSLLLRHMATTLTGRREEVDHEGQVLALGLDHQEGKKTAFARRLWVDG